MGRTRQPRTCHASPANPSCVKADVQAVKKARRMRLTVHPRVCLQSLEGRDRHLSMPGVFDLDRDEVQPRFGERPCPNLRCESA